MWVCVWEGERWLHTYSSLTNSNVGFWKVVEMMSFNIGTIECSELRYEVLLYLLLCCWFNECNLSMDGAVRIWMREWMKKNSTFFVYICVCNLFSTFCCTFNSKLWIDWNLVAPNIDREHLDYFWMAKRMHFVALWWHQLRSTAVWQKYNPWFVAIDLQTKRNKMKIPCWHTNIFVCWYSIPGSKVYGLFGFE